MYMLESLLEVAVPFSLLVISIIGFFIKKTLTTIEGTQVKLGDALTSIHTDFQVSKSEFVAVKESLTRTNSIVDRQDSKMDELNTRMYTHGHGINETKNKVDGFSKLVIEDNKRITEVEKDLIALKSKQS